MTTSNDVLFNRNFLKHQQHLQLRGLQPKTIEAYLKNLEDLAC